MGVTENIGDQPTYWILDEQSKQLVARSVVHPLNNNRRVKWDPALSGKTSSSTDKDHTFTDGGKMPYVPAEEDTYSGASKLRYSYGNIKQITISDSSQGQRKYLMTK